MCINLIYLISIVIIITFIINNCFIKDKGEKGEKIVADIIDTLPSHKYKSLNNIMIYTDKGMTQIDHIIVSVYGIFVIETKNYSGKVTGSTNSEYWKHILNGRKYSFYNPLKQNYGHIKKLQSLLNLKKDDFISIVVFSDNADLKCNVDANITNFYELKNVIRKYRDRKISESDIESIINTIKNADVYSGRNKRKHVKKIKKTIKKNDKRIKRGICPKCRGRLIMKEGEFGYFLGCKNYPSCKYTIDINE